MRGSRQGIAVDETQSPPCCARPIMPLPAGRHGRCFTWRPSTPADDSRQPDDRTMRCPSGMDCLLARSLGSTPKRDRHGDGVGMTRYCVLLHYETALPGGPGGLGGLGSRICVTGREWRTGR